VEPGREFDNSAMLPANATAIGVRSTRKDTADHTPVAAPGSVAGAAFGLSYGGFSPIHSGAATGSGGRVAATSAVYVMCGCDDPANGSV
jgi:hypothetical protein